MSLPTDLQVEVTLNMVSEEYTYPYTGDFSLGGKLETLNQEMGNVAGSVCTADNCESTFNQTEENN